MFLPLNLLPRKMNLEYRPKLYYCDPIENYFVDAPFYPIMNKPELVTLKPTMSCNLNCKHCLGRIKKFTHSGRLTIRDYGVLIKDLKDLGTQTICVSGGEPLLYPELLVLIKIAFMQGLAVTLNTNGLLLTSNKLFELIEAGIVGINLSIDSPKAKVHDKLRNKKGLLEHIIKVLSENDSITHYIILNIRMILSKYNYKDLPEMIQFVHKVKADILSIDLIEDDSKKRSYLLSIKQIKEFQNKIKPVLIQQLKLDYFENKNLINLGIKQINGIFNIKLNNSENFAKGIYWPDEHIRKKCSIPSSFMIIEGDGSVLPCNAVEYYRSPVIGNVLRTGIKNLWTSPEWEAFRVKKSYYCQLCPMNQSTSIFFTEKIIRRTKDEEHNLPSF